MCRLRRQACRSPRSLGVKPLGSRQVQRPTSRCFVSQTKCCPEQKELPRSVTSCVHRRSHSSHGILLRGFHRSRSAFLTFQAAQRACTHTPRKAAMPIQRTKEDPFSRNQKPFFAHIRNNTFIRGNRRDLPPPKPSLAGMLVFGLAERKEQGHGRWERAGTW